MVAEVCLGKVGAVAAREVSRFARNSREWQQLIEVCRIVDTVLIDQETVYAPRQSNDRLLLGLKGSLNEYELDLLRQRSVEARYEKARRGELVITAPVGYIKTDEQRLEKNPDRRVQEAISLVFRKFRELGTVRQTLLWFLEHDLQLPTQNAREELFWRRPSYRMVHRLITNPCGSSKWLRAVFTLLPTNGNDGEDRPAGMRTRFGCENENAFRRLVSQECSCSDLYEFGLDGSKQGSHDQAGEDDTR
jgi:hypothetical protein